MWNDVVWLRRQTFRFSSMFFFYKNVPFSKFISQSPFDKFGFLEVRLQPYGEEEMFFNLVFGHQTGV